MSSASMTNDTSRYHSKVNSILYACLIMSILNGILLDTPSHLYDRLARSTGAWEEALGARGLKSDVREAWKRRRKKPCSCTGVSAEDTPESPPDDHRSLRPRLRPPPKSSLEVHPESRAESPPESPPRTGVSARQAPESPA